MKRLNYLAKDRFIALLTVASLAFTLVSQSLFVPADAANDYNNQVRVGVGSDGEEYFVDPTKVDYYSVDGNTITLQQSGKEVENPDKNTSYEDKGFFGESHSEVTYELDSKDFFHTDAEAVPVTVEKTAEQATDENGNEIENQFDITLTVDTEQDVQEFATTPDSAISLALDISGSMQDDQQNDVIVDADGKISSGDLTGEKAHLDDLIAGTIDFIQDYAESGRDAQGNATAERWISFTTYATYAYPLYVANEDGTQTYWFDVADKTQEIQAISVIDRLQLVKLVSAESVAGGPFLYAIRYNTEGEIDEILTRSELGKQALLTTSEMQELNKTTPIQVVGDEINDPYTQADAEELRWSNFHHGHKFANTNMEGAIYVADALLREADVVDIDNKNLVLMFDGNNNRTNSLTEADSDLHDKSLSEVIERINVKDEGGGDKTQAESALAAVAENGNELHGLIYDTYNSPSLKQAQNMFPAEYSNNVVLVTDEGNINNSFGSLYEGLEAITTTILNGAQLWTVTDPIPEGFKVIDDGHTFDKENNLSWDLKYAEDIDTSENNFKYQYTYRIEMDTTDTDNEGNNLFDAGNFYPTNGQTTLTYLVLHKEHGDGEGDLLFGKNGRVQGGQFIPNTGFANDTEIEMFTADFRVPTVEPLFADLEFTKKDKNMDFNLKGAVFTIYQLNEENIKVPVATATSNVDGLVSFENLPKGEYIIQETTAPDALQDGGMIYYFEKDANEYDFTVAWGEVSGEFATKIGEDKIFTNEFDTKETERQITKVWQNIDGTAMESAPVDEVTFYLYDANDVTITTDENDLEISREVNKDAQPVGTAVVNQENMWTANFMTAAGETKFPSFTETGAPISYVVIEGDYNGSEDYKPAYSIAKPVIVGDEVTMYTYTVTNKMFQNYIEIPVSKTWILPTDENGDMNTTELTATVKLQRTTEDGAPEDVTTADGEVYSIVLKAPNFSDSFENLPVTDAYGNPYTYSVVETAVNGALVANSGYSVVYNNKEVEADSIESSDAFSITNVLNQGTTSKTGEKEWTVPSDVTKPTVTVSLYNGIDADAVETKILTEGTGYTYTFTNLPTYKWEGDDDNNNGIIDASEVTEVLKYNYSVVEKVSPADGEVYDETLWYNSVPSDVSVENVYKGTRNIYITKTWADESITDVSVQYTLTRNGTTIATEIIAGPVDEYQLASDLPMYDAYGTEYNYKVSETVINTDDSGYAYTKTPKDVVAHSEDKDGIVFPFENSRTSTQPGEFELEVNKTWKAPSTANTDDISVIITATSNDENAVLSTLYVNEFGNLVKLAEGDAVPTHTVVNDTLSLTLPTQYEVTGTTTKEETYIDPDTGEEITETVEVETTSLVNLVYTVTETNVPDGYTETYSVGEGEELVETNSVTAEEGTTQTVDITNDYQEYITVEVNKSWVWPEGIERPTSLEFELYKDVTTTDEDSETTTEQVPVEKSGELNTIEGIVHSFEQLPKYDGNKVEINYTVKEVSTQTNFTPSYGIGSYDELGDNVLTIPVTNTIVEEYAPISVQKSWSKPSDISAHDVEIALYQDDVEVARVTILANEANTQFTFVPAMNDDGSYPYGYDAQNGWPKYDISALEAKTHVYTIKELTTDDKFTTTNPEVVAFGQNTVTNSYVDPEIERVVATKLWVAPEGTEFPVVEFQLYRYTDSIEQAEKVGDTKSTLGGTETSQTVEFTNLPKYSAGHKTYNYFVEEVTVPTGYTMDERNFENAPLVVTNRIEQDYFSIDVNKTWDLTNAPEGTTEKPITITLYKGDEVEETVTLDGVVDEVEATPWNYTFTELEMYNISTGESIVDDYRVEEGEVNANDLKFFTSTQEEEYYVEDNWMEINITNTYAEYKYQVIRHYRAEINGVITSSTVPHEVVNLTQAERDALTDFEAVEQPSSYVRHEGLTYTYQARLSNDSVAIVEPGTLYEINLYYNYFYESSDPDDPDPDDPDPDDPDPDDPIPPIDIPDEEPPLAEIPDPEPPLVEIPDPEPPLADLPDDEIVIVEPEVPLGELPQTGGIYNNSNAELFVLLIGMSVSAWFIFESRRKESEGDNK